MNVFKSLARSGVRPARFSDLKYDKAELRPIYDHFKNSQELDQHVNECKERPAVFLDSHAADGVGTKFIDRRLAIARGI